MQLRPRSAATISRAVITTTVRPADGEGYLTWQPINTDRYKFAAWRTLPGEHRVRKGPSLSYDTPDPDASGYQNLDEYYVFFGGPDRYEFKLLGKQEMYVPYNNNALYARPVKEIAGSSHVNPDALRYELHRVWVVEGTVAPGKRRARRNSISTRTPGLRYIAIAGTRTAGCGSSGMARCSGPRPARSHIGKPVRLRPSSRRLCV